VRRFVRTLWIMNPGAGSPKSLRDGDPVPDHNWLSQMTAARARVREVAGKPRRCWSRVNVTGTEPCGQTSTRSRRVRFQESSSSAVRSAKPTVRLSQERFQVALAVECGQYDRHSVAGSSALRCACGRAEFARSAPRADLWTWSLISFRVLSPKSMRRARYGSISRVRASGTESRVVIRESGPKRPVTVSPQCDFVT